MQNVYKISSQEHGHNSFSHDFLLIYVNQNVPQKTSIADNMGSKLGSI